MVTLFPSLIIQQQVHSLSTRHIVPRGESEFDFVWTHFGFADDNEEMTRRRCANASEVYHVGRYIDGIVETPAGLKLASRLCAYGSEMVLNSPIHPI